MANPPGPGWQSSLEFVLASKTMLLSFIAQSWETFRFVSSRQRIWACGARLMPPDCLLHVPHLRTRIACRVVRVWGSGFRCLCVWEAR